MSATTRYNPFITEAFALSLITAGVPHHIDTPSVVVNLGRRTAQLDHGDAGVIAPRASTVLDDVTVAGDLLAVVATPDRNLDPGEFTRDWLDFYGGTPVLLRSPQVEVGTVDLDLREVMRRDDAPAGDLPFVVRLNLWWSPAGTDCGIHRRHDFLEVHTQISGVGHMEKFRSDDHGTRYEDQPMAPGCTNPVPFCASPDGHRFDYPWHQYRAETDCVWLAVEYHRTTP